MVGFRRIVALFAVLFAVVPGSPTYRVSTNAPTKGTQNLQNNYQILLQKRVEEKGIYRNPKVLPVEEAHQIVNDYIDDIEVGTNTQTDGSDTALSSLPKLPACANQYEHPFPGFICPLMTTLGTDYKIWRRQVPDNYSILVEKMGDLNLHPCDHNTSSCVVMALPDNHILFGCVDDKTGELKTPKDWNTDVQQSLNDTDYVFDFRVPNPISIRKKCHATQDGTPICVRNNLFYKGRMIIQDIGCCCKGDFCGDVLFDQSGFNPLPFIRVEVDLDPDHTKMPPEELFGKLIHNYKEPTRNSCMH
ncbi:hypothetical protein QR680_013624 [Steinernema hermaphroditum]|uniref:Uncharacterized protein n=1 Tax=Steinernema hermaphroditum TaxID=289476 RepID=A0AA39I650_9BILA|nr:hypothetical protein QR680_013624 [Steinernema hermaphroditum]